MHQPWRSFAAIINKCLSGRDYCSGKSSPLTCSNSFGGMYHNKQVDYVYLLWEDLVFQVENKNSKKNNDMDDFMFTTIRVISKHKDTQEYGAILPQHLTNKAIIKTSAKGDKPAITKSKGLTVLSEVALSEADQIKLETKRSLKEFHISHASGSGDGIDILSKVPDVQQQTRSGTNEGAGDKLKVPGIPEYRPESKEKSWTFSQGEDEEEDEKHDNNDDNDDNDDE
ncbi:hypothetical protein Tco_0101389, partial [Tanacetum coccineum]